MTDEHLTIDPPETETATGDDTGKTPQDRGNLISRHPVLVVAGGLAIGLIAAALMPGSTRRKLVQRTTAVANAAGEAGVRLGKQGAARLDRLGEALGENTAEARRRTAEVAGHARDAGIDWAKAAVSLLAALRR